MNIKQQQQQQQQHITIDWLELTVLVLELGDGHRVARCHSADIAVTVRRLQHIGGGEAVALGPAAGELVIGAAGSLAAVRTGRVTQCGEAQDVSHHRDHVRDLLGQEVRLGHTGQRHAAVLHVTKERKLGLQHGVCHRDGHLHMHLVAHL